MIPIGLQLYSIRDDCAKDLAGSLIAVADMGYDGVEFAGYHGNSASELQTMVDDLGLKVCGTSAITGSNSASSDCVTTDFEKNIIAAKVKSRMIPTMMKMVTWPLEENLWRRL